MKKKSILIFDFDGTIADSLPLGVKILNELSIEFKFRTITESEIPAFKQKTPAQIIKEFGIPFYKIPFIAAKLKAIMKERITEVEIIPGIAEVLQMLKQQGLQMGIITSNKEDVVEAFLEIHNLSSIFEFIHAEKNLFGKHKAFEKVIKLRNFSKEEILYVGDEVRDIEACKKANLDVVSVTWGFNTRELLETYDPNFIIDEPKQLLTIV